ncbi:MAG: AraC family transcriptional regulator [Paludibacteraceae bacterium]|nr:AraC family transcriptional regulator [Paludibacteraceae bacterium]
MEEGRVFEEMYRAIDTTEMAVLRNVNRFPVYGKDVISPCMMVCINHSGVARALYDMQEVVFRPNEIAVVMPDHILRPLESSPDYSVTLLVHSPSLCEELKTKRLTHDYHKYHHQPACLLTDEEMAQYMRAVDLLEHICKTSTQRYPLRHEMLIQLTNVMSEMHNAFRREIDEKILKEDNQYAVFNAFCDMLAMHYREQHEVAFYAEKAHLTARHFSVIIKEVVGISASDYIEQYLATQAKNLLTTRPDLSVQQISYHLGYADSPSFCRFFKRMTDKTPKDFRQLTA